MSIEKITSNDLKDLNIGLQIDKILNTQLQTYKTKPRKIESPFGEEMVKEYKNELNKPVIITDSFGNEQSFKYHPASSIPVFDPYVPIHAMVPNKADIRADMLVTVGLIKDADDKRVAMEIEDKRLLDLYNLVPKGSTGKADRVAIITERNLLKIAYVEIKKDIAALEAEYKRLEQLFNDIEVMISDNQAEQSRIDTINRTKSQSFIDEMNVLNSGSFNVKKMDTESEEQYLERLKENALLPADNTYIEVEAEIDNIKKFKENMKHLISSNTLIEQILRSLDTDSIFTINSVFNLIKENFLKIFGFNNKNLKLDEIRDFMLNIANQKTGLLAGMSTKSKLIMPPPSTASLATAPPIPFTSINTDVKLIEVDNSIIFSNDNTGQRLHIKIGEDTRGKKIYVMFSSDGNVGTYENVNFQSLKPATPGYDRSFKKLLMDIGLTIANISNLFGKTPTEPNVKSKIIDAPPNGFGLIAEPTTLYHYEPNPAGGTSKGQHIHGMGLILDEIPKYVKFGKILIKLDKLFYNNILTIRDKNKFNIKTFKDVPVSDEFVQLIMKMVNSYVPNYMDVKRLKLNEKELFDMLLYTSGVHKIIDTATKDNTITNLKARLEIVEGEIDAGNNNIEVLNELQEVLNNLSNLGIITKAAAKRHYNTIKKDYF